MNANGSSSPSPSSSPQPPGAESTNIRLFSEKLKELIGEAVGTGAVHPAAAIGVLAYHQSAMGAHFQAAFIGAQPKPTTTLLRPPPGFRLPAPPAP